MRRRLLGRLAVLLCLLPGLAGCWPQPAQRAVPWNRESFSAAALAYLQDKYHEDFVVTDVKWTTNWPWGNDLPYAMAHRLGDDRLLAQFWVGASTKNQTDTPDGRLFRDYYLSVVMAPAYQALVETQIADLFEQSRVVSFITSIPQDLGKDTAVEEFMTAASDYIWVRLAIGVLMPAGTTETDLVPVLATIQTRLAAFPASHVDLNIQVFTDAVDYYGTVTRAEDSFSDPSHLLDYQMFDDPFGSIYVHNSWAKLP